MDKMPKKYDETICNFSDGYDNTWHPKLWHGAGRMYMVSLKSSLVENFACLHIAVSLWLVKEMDFSGVQ